MFLRFIAIALLLASCTAPSALSQVSVAQTSELGIRENESFEQWRANFEVKALAKGITQSTLDAALDNARPVNKVVALDRNQPEKKQTLDEYLDNVINDYRVEKGRKLLVENYALLADISAKTGVEPEFIVALWGLESGYGENIGSFPVVNSLSTMAYEGRRREFFEAELINALKIIQKHNMPPEALRGSWAGAMGQCQFMPSTYLAYAVDYDGDGRIDIWDNKQDVLASIGNYLANIGWGKSDEEKDKALKNWNRSSYFVASVFALAERIK